MAKLFLQQLKTPYGKFLHDFRNGRSVRQPLRNMKIFCAFARTECEGVERRSAEIRRFV